MIPCRNSKKNLSFIILAAFALLTYWPANKALALNGREIMERVNERETGDRSTSEMEMILIDKKGRKRVREIRSFGMEKGEDSLSLMFFLSPADVKNTGFLTFDYDASGKDDDQWLYLPALRKTKRIASGDKSGSFMGSDFNYSDMTSPDLDEYEYTLMKETKVRDKPVWQIKAVPKSKEEIEESGSPSRCFSFARTIMSLFGEFVGCTRKNSTNTWMSKNWSRSMESGSLPRCK